MKEGKYYDVSRSRLIGDADGFAYAEWAEQVGLLRNHPRS
jgi:hypothetical protein